jgi:hypothetical protein
MKVATFIVVFVVIVPAVMALANQVIKAQTGADFGWLLGIACGLIVGASAGFFSGRFVKSLRD